jgi:hypothetical protein
MKVFNIISLVISFITILGLSFSISEINVNQVLGQTNALKTNLENTTDTFNMNGAISSLIFVSDATTDNGTSWNVSDDKKFILSGYWDLAANNGTITKFNVNFTKVLSDGTKWHSHEFINFKTNDSHKVLLDSDKNLSVSGILDVNLNNLIPYNNTSTEIIISKGDTIKFILENKSSGNHFFDQPIYGIVKVNKVNKWQRRK